MKPGQDRIYFVIADSVDAARSSPHIEQLKALGVEVLLMSERVDEWVMGQVESFEGKKLQGRRARRPGTGRPRAGGREGQAKEQSKESEGLLKRVKDTLGERIEPKCASASRLTDSPSCLALGEHDMGLPCGASSRPGPEECPRPSPRSSSTSSIPGEVSREVGQTRASSSELAQLLYEQAALAEGGQLVNPAEYVRRLNRLLVRLAVPA
jgi:molecular chaperone HtpG